MCAPTNRRGALHLRRASVVVQRFSPYLSTRMCRTEHLSGPPHGGEFHLVGTLPHSALLRHLVGHQGREITPSEDPHDKDQDDRPRILKQADQDVDKAGLLLDLFIENLLQQDRKDESVHESSTSCLSAHSGVKGALFRCITREQPIITTPI